MTVYLIALAKEDREAWGKVRSEWPGRYHIVSETMAFVSPEGIATPESIRDLIGIEPSSNRSGIIVTLAADRISGVLPSAAVDWIRAADNGYSAEIPKPDAQQADRRTGRPY